MQNHILFYMGLRGAPGSPGDRCAGRALFMSTVLPLLAGLAVDLRRDGSGRGRGNLFSEPAPCFLQLLFPCLWYSCQHVCPWGECLCSWVRHRWVAVC